MRLGLDVTPLLGAPGGVATFVGELMAALGSHADGPDLVPFVLSGRAPRAAVAAAGRGRPVLRVPLPAAVARPLWRLVRHPVAERWVGEVDVVHGTNFVVPPTRSAAQLVTVHDLSYVHEQSDLPADIVAFDRDVAAAVDRGATLHVHSRCVAAEVRARYPGADVAVVQAGVRVVDSGVVAGEARRSGPEVLLAVGRTERRKQYDRLVRAFGLLAPRRADLRLVLAGPPGRAEPAVAAAIAALPDSVAARVDRRFSPSDAERDRLYRRAGLFVHPARYEGFGLPLLEAMAHGVPVLAASCDAATEVSGDAAWFVPPDASDDDLAGAIGTLLDSPDVRLGLARRGAARAAGYTWERTAEEMLALYHRVLGRRR